MDIKDFGSRIQQLIAGRDLDADTAYAMFCDVLRNEQPDLQQGAFLAALVAKGETTDELYAAWRAIDEIDTVHVTPKVSTPICENSGTGMDGMNTINVSTAAAIVAAAGGVAMARHGARALSSRCGTVDLVEALDIAVECDADVRAVPAHGLLQALRMDCSAMIVDIHPVRGIGDDLNIGTQLA